MRPGERLAAHAKNYTPIYAPAGIPWLSEYMVMTHFQVCKRTLWVWHKKGLPRYRIGHLTLYKESDLNNMIEKHRVLSRKNKSSKKTAKPKKPS